MPEENMAAPVALELKAVSKRYVGTLAVDGVDMAVRRGEVHALVGENGAGKSSLMKIVAGSFDDYTGDVLVNGKPVLLHSPGHAKAAGIAMIHQELCLARPLSVAENILAGQLPAKGPLLDRGRLRNQARQWLDRVGLSVDPDTLVEDLPQHEAQLVEIAKALSHKPQILVMDEPTSALGREEVERLFKIIDDLKLQGLSILYISHHLPEIFRVADRVTVMRDGKKVGSYGIGEVDARSLVEKMIGGAVSDFYAERRMKPGAVKLKARGLTRIGFFHECSFDLHAGEILGIGGLSGAGRSELARALCALDPLDSGRVWLDGREIAPSNYAEAIRCGLAYLSEDRKNEGLALRLSNRDNILSAVIERLCRFGFFPHGAGGREVFCQMDGLAVQPRDPAREVSSLSGGNQQKVLLGKWLATRPEVLILDEPTRGVDVGAKRVIHEAVAALADQGRGVILISSDLPELVGLSDRIIILRQGRLIGQMAGDKRNEEAVLLAANGERSVLAA